jgi:crotonobetainyl-CoA:carnitine CoA-transferase CaiB-like acyl-CoA transferase
MRLLDDVTVVSLEQAVAGPFATRQLADLGARVIKIERPGSGDFARHYDESVKGMSSHFVWLNRSKESLTLDVKSEQGRRILARLVEDADVFVSNLGPGAVERLGFSAKELRARHPHLIVCEISGYGGTGPYRSRKAYDLLVQAESGLLSITGTEASPAKVGISVADIAAGMYAYTGILTALLKRAKTGEGSAVEVTLLEALGEWMGYPAYYTGYGGLEPRRAGTHHATIAPYGDVETADGELVYIGVQNEREWRRFCDVVLVRPELAEDARFRSNALRVENREELFDLLDTLFAGLTTAEAHERLVEADIAHAQVSTVLDFIRHPQLSARDRWREVDSPVGLLSTLLPPANVEGLEPVLEPVPDVGEHTERILEELGYGEAERTRLRAEGVT